MRCPVLVITIFLTLCQVIFSTLPSETTHSLVVLNTNHRRFSRQAENDLHPNPQIYAMHIQTNITNRYATTLITSKVKNVETESAETTFSVVLPENAFISRFAMEVDGKIYEAYVREKGEAKKIYEEAVSKGQSAGHVELSVRDSETFQISINVEPKSKTIFHLVYEELLQRQLGQYELVVNIRPGQFVDDLSVEVQIKESRPLTFVQVPALRTGNEISKNDNRLRPSADVAKIDASSAVVRFKPDVKQQKSFAKLLGSERENEGLPAQFVVQYDVERDTRGGEVLVDDGYFVQFFAPPKLAPLPKHMVFVLDHSGSMSGEKIDQLTTAMQNILPQLNRNDLFSLVRFSDEAWVWHASENYFSEVKFDPLADLEQLEGQLNKLELPKGVEATEKNIEKAKKIVKDHKDLGSTNIISGLEVGWFLLKRTQKELPGRYKPMMVFLTDGMPNAGMTSPDQITNKVTKINSGVDRIPIFSLSFGEDADKLFLRELSSRNLGFSKHIYEAADASLQLEGFYEKISAPVLSDVSFKYTDGVVDVTNTHFPLFFNGSELVVVGKTIFSEVVVTIDGLSSGGPVRFEPDTEKPVASLERLWAYMTVKELLQEMDKVTNKDELKKKALDLAMKYSFVTSITSLVVVKPNTTNLLDNEGLNEIDTDTDIRFANFPGPGRSYNCGTQICAQKNISVAAFLLLYSYCLKYAFF